MNRPQSRRQRAKLYAFDAAAFDEGNRVLKIVVRVLRAVRRKVPASGQRLAINSFYNTKLVRAYLNQLNAELLTRLQRSGEAFLSNAVVRGTFLLRACIVNFRTSLEDIEALPALVTRIGREVDAVLRPAELTTYATE